jgi:hypothetical protein
MIPILNSFEFIEKKRNAAYVKPVPVRKGDEPK